MTTACYRLEIIKQTGSADLPKEIVEVINDTTKISGDDLTIAAINKEEAKRQIQEHIHTQLFKAKPISGK